MKALTRSIVLAGVSVVAASGLMAQSKPSHIDQWFRGKFGQASPPEEAKLRAERAAAAFRALPVQPAEKPLPYIDQYFRGKHGQFSPMEEARLRQEREKAALGAQPTNPKTESHIDQWLRMKQGINR